MTDAKAKMFMSASRFESRASTLFRHSDFVILQSPFALYRSRSLSSRAHHIPKCHGLIVPSWFRLQEKAVKAAKVRPELPAIYRRNKFESCIPDILDRKSTRLNSSHRCISYAVFCLKKKSSYTMIL